jgi:hypothetical protein
MRVGAVVLCLACRGSPPDILHVTGEHVRLRLVKARSGAPIANADVTLDSDTGVRCIRAPCPSRSADWTGRSDGRGEVEVPTRVLHASTVVSAPGASATLVERAARDAHGTWTVALDPQPPASEGPR